MNIPPRNARPFSFTSLFSVFFTSCCEKLDFQQDILWNTGLRVSSKGLADERSGSRGLQEERRAKRASGGCGGCRSSRLSPRPARSCPLHPEWSSAACPSRLLHTGLPHNQQCTPQSVHHHVVTTLCVSFHRGFLSSHTTLLAVTGSGLMHFFKLLKCINK